MASFDVTLFLADAQSGGSEIFALRLARALAQQGFKPRFLLVRRAGSLVSCLEKDFPLAALGGKSYGFFSLACALPALVRFLKKDRPPVIVSGLPLLNIVLALAVRWTGLQSRLIMVEHMRLAPWAGEKLSWRKKLRNLALKLTYRAADQVVAVSRTVAEDLTRFAALDTKKIAIIPPAFLPENLKDLAEAVPPHPWLRDKTSPVLVAMGRLLPVKDFACLLEAFALAREKRADLRLVLFGEGPERSRLESLARQLNLFACVAFAGVTDNPFSALRAADLFVLSSRSEAFGNVVAEALACGTRAVATACGGPQEILQEGRLGLLVPARDAPALAKAILQRIEEPACLEIPQEEIAAFTARRAGENWGRLLRASFWTESA